MPRDRGLQTPWLREELVDHLMELSDTAWLLSVVDAAGGPTDALDEILDFLDDTGVVDEPAGRIGYILEDDGEVAAMSTLGAELRSALVARADPHWRAVADAAGVALAVLQRSSPKDRPSG
jgi:hypothetical protein